MPLQLTYRKATIKDFEDLYLIKCDRANIEWGGFKEAPNRERFFEWYKTQITSDKRTIYLVYDLDNPCAFFYIDKVDDVTYEFSSSGVLSQYVGKGIGSYTVRVRIEIIRRLGGKNLITWIAVQKDCVDIIFKIKKGVYLTVSAYSLSEGRLLLACDWGTFWNRLKSMRNRKDVLAKFKKACPLATNIFTNTVSPHFAYI